MKCPKCKIRMEKFVSFGNKKNIMYECPKCDYSDFSKTGIKELKESEKDIKEGRTYLFSCATKRKGSNKCKTSGEELTVCFSCHAKECEKWYKLGLKDGNKKRRG